MVGSVGYDAVPGARSDLTSPHLQDSLPSDFCNTMHTTVYQLMESRWKKSELCGRDDPFLKVSTDVPSHRGGEGTICKIRPPKIPPPMNSSHQLSTSPTSCTHNRNSTVVSDSQDAPRCQSPCNAPRRSSTFEKFCPFFRRP